jgi:hypothetical protein
MSKVACHPAEKHQALEQRLQALADTRSALAGRMAELHELRRCVQQAGLSEELKKPPLTKRIVRPGRLFMLGQWTVGQSASAGSLSSTRWTS